MADVARTAIVSNENRNGLIVTEESIKNGPSDGSNHLTECSVANHATNNCSSRTSISCFESKESGYQEIDSFSELSFKTTDEISLQDLMESEFAARISNISNGDEQGWIDGSEKNKSRDPFDDLFGECVEGDRKKSKGETEEEKVKSGNDKGEFDLEDFIGGPTRGNSSLIEDYLEYYRMEEEREKDGKARKNSKSVNIFKSEETAILTNFDPFTAIEEDSDCSNPGIPNSSSNGGLDSPEEFPFPAESSAESKDGNKGGKAEEEEEEEMGVEEDESIEKANNENGGVNCIEVNTSRNDGMRELFTKTVSDENLETDFGKDEKDESKFHVVDGMERVYPTKEPSIPNLDHLVSTDGIEPDEFFSSEDFFESRKEEETTEEESQPTGKTLEEISTSGKVELFADEEEPEDFPKEEKKNRNSPISKNSIFDLEDEEGGEEGVEMEEDKWMTVEEILKAQPENFELEGDSSSLVEDENPNEKSIEESNKFIEASTNTADDPENSWLNGGLTESDSETESKSDSSERKTVKKKKSKKGKKSDEKENISVELVSNKCEKWSPNLNELHDLSNVSVKNLMLTYSSEGPKSLENHWCGKGEEPIPVQSLKARSMLDLTSNSKKVASLRSDLFENSKNLETSRSTTNLYGGEKYPIVTGVSVQALKSSFSKFDQLSKKTILHVRSVDASKVQKQFSEASMGISEVDSNCKSCGKQVFQMEQIKAEKSVWHRNCFRCKECNKQLSVDTYSSNEGILYCKPHFKELFKPKAVLDDDSEPVKLKKPELIIRENQPVELPPEVVRASDKPDLGLEELASLNVKSRYQVFEKGEETIANGNSSADKSSSNISVKRSPSILSKLAKFQKKGIDVGVRDEELNGLPMEQSSTSGEEDEEEKEDETAKKIFKSKKVRERPMSFSKMDDVKSAWEHGVAKTREEMREERRSEIHQIRSKLFMGKQVKMKEAYEQAVRESENVSPRKSIEVKSEKAKSIKECFEKGEPLNVDYDNEVEEKKKVVEDDRNLFEAGISKKSRSLFLELDKSAKTQVSSAPKKGSSKSPVSSSPKIREVTDNVVKCSDAIEDVQIETADVSSKFKFFETYKEPEREKKKFRITPPREGQVKEESPEKEVYRDPNVVRASDKMESEIIRTNTTAKMLSLFRQMEEKTEEIPDGPKPLKRFTPPPDYKGKSDGESETEESEGDEEEEEEEENENNPGIVRASDKIEDEYLKQAANAARAKQLKAKFENWEEEEKVREEESVQKKLNGSTANPNNENSENVEVTSIECTKSLRARFESMKGDGIIPREKVARPKVNRFVEIQNNMAEMCEVCRRRVYQLEKVETSGKIFHKSCFRCMQCNCLLRMESFTLNCGNLYCLPHFKQKFFCKGSYDEGFGVDEHKANGRQ